jgi:hypothetical protein
MSPREVQSLQELAMKNGGSLTINPETGLPEAGFLDSLLPVIAGAALNFFLPGAGAAVGGMFGMGAAAGTGIMVGGLTGLATGSLEKGLMAGMGAYGGAGLAEGLVGSGAEALSAQQIAAEQAANGAGAMRGAYVPGPDISQAGLNASRTSLLSEGVSNLGTSAGRDAAMNAMGGGMGALKYGAAAIAPIMADQMVQTTTQAPAQTSPSKIRQKIYDPISGTYTNVGDVDASQYGNRSFSDIYRGYADGGIVALARGDLVQDTTFQPAINDQAAAKAAAMAPVIPVAPATTAAPAFTAQQIQDAIAASRQQGFNNDQILQGAQAKFGVDVSQYLSPAPAPAPAANNGNGLLSSVAPAVREFLAANPNALSTAAPRGGMFGNVANIGTNLSPDTTAASTSSAAEPSIVRVADQGTAPTAAPRGGMFGNVANISTNLGAAPAATTGGLSTLATTGTTPGANNAAAGAGGDSGVLTLLANQGAKSVTGGTTAAAAAPVDQQALAVQAVQTGINAGKTPAQIAAEVNTQYGKNFTAQNVSDFAAANAPALNTAGISNAAIYAATNKDFKGAAGDTGLAGLNANIKAAMEKTATAKPNATAAEIKSILAGYGADSSDFKRAMGMTPEEWDATHGIINTPRGATVIEDGTGVLTDTGKLLPVSTLTDGTQVVVNPTQVATTGVNAPTVLNEAARTALPVGVSGNQTATINPNGTVSMNTGTPNAPAGGYTGMTSLRDAYTKGGGSLGYTPYTPKTVAELNQKYANTGDTKSAYDYLTGKGAYPTKSNVGQIMRPYAEATLGMPAAGNRSTIWDQASGRYIKNPDYVRPMRDSKGDVTYGMSQKELNTFLTNQAKNPTMSGQELYDWAVKNNVTAQDIADARGVPLSEVYAQFRGFKQAADATTATAKTGQTLQDSGIALDADGKPIKTIGQASGGMAGYAVGGGLGSLGSYSDGGRLLRGPGDGVSDDIPASIGQSQQPARLADGEFVVPARIVSELGNGSTEAGARKLYAMMDRVQRARGKTTGKNRVAANTSADKYLPA